ncbi:carbohydrate-binding protein [Erwinia sp. 198]|uniref:carbohydrate-binding protein n=1 Tax=Erwinia sp. 198 TaxID=2022746 RepID=UPI000F665B7C|nr:hypothetical protein EGK14_16570 [Erwinia sp. 198]
MKGPTWSAAVPYTGGTVVSHNGGNYQANDRWCRALNPGWCPPPGLKPAMLCRGNRSDAKVITNKRVFTRQRFSHAENSIGQRGGNCAYLSDRKNN